MRSTDVVFKNRWIELASIVDNESGTSEPFYALSSSDYVGVVGFTTQESLVAVRQYRPAVGKFTVELPGGHVDPGEAAEVSALRELEEETGYRAQSVELLGKLCPDTGRLTNRSWCFFASGLERVSGWHKESGVEVIEIPRSELRQWILRGDFDHAQNLAVIALAVAHGKRVF